jgi:hypothetical protein
VVSGKEIWVEVNAKETKHMLMFHELNVEQKGKPENIIWLFFMRIDNDFPFTRILFHINSTLINVLLPLNHISYCTFGSDFDTF